MERVLNTDNNKKDKIETDEDAANDIIIEVRPPKGSAARSFLRDILRFAKSYRFELIFIFTLIVLDLTSKALIDTFMVKGQTITLIPNFLSFYYTHNKNAAFGSSFGLDTLLGEQGVRIFLLVFSAIAIVLFCFFLAKFRGKSKLAKLSIAAIIAGAIGNFFDRVTLGYVRDFIQFEYFGCTVFGNTAFAIFNIADSALVIGVILFAFFFIFMYKEEEKKPAESAVANSDNAQGKNAVAQQKTDSQNESNAANPDNESNVANPDNESNTANPENESNVENPENEVNTTNTADETSTEK